MEGRMVNCSTGTGTTTPASLVSRLSRLPGLEALASQLSDRLAPGYEPRPLAEYGRRLAEEWNVQRMRFLKAKAVENAVHEMIVDFEVKERAEPQSSEESRAFGKLKECLTNAELDNYLTLLGTGQGDVTLLGLTSSDLRGAKPIPSECKSLIVQRLEEHLFEVCFNLLSQLKREGDDYNAMSTRERFECVQGLPEMVRGEADSVAEFVSRTGGGSWGAEGAGEDSGDDFGTEWRLLEALMKNFEMLNALATKYRMGLQANVDETTASYLSVKCQTLALKVRCLELEILTSTYKPASIQALKKISDHLKDRIAKTIAAIEQTKGNLQQYEAVGKSFEEVVGGYAQVKADIEGKKWALKELKETV